MVIMMGWLPFKTFTELFFLVIGRDSRYVKYPRRLTGLI